ncbi:MAG: hypothetical protein IT445_13015 [Phycisphaeraceae bacterium]|nr:hypothetical protein [Phycisphaeraceae bacterium]
MGDPRFIHRSRTSTRRQFDHRYRFEHWYLDNQVYSLTARVRDRLPAFAGEQSKATFWQQFDRYTTQCGFTPWVTSLLDNHWHSLGYLRQGSQLLRMMRLIHGSVAKLVNDLLEDVPTSVGMPPGRIAPPFWRDSGHQNYFDGCLRDLKQGRLTYRYVLTQCRRHGICHDPHDYPHTRVNVEMDRALRRAEQLQAFLHGVGYKRYGTRAADHAD